MKRNLRFEAFYDVTPSDVWRALTDRDELAQWLMPNDLILTIGHKFQFRDKPQPGWDGIVHCEVLEVEPGKRLSYSWKSAALDTVVTWTVKPHPNGTTLILEHNGFSGWKAVFVSMMLNRGWRSTLLAKKLPATLRATKTFVK